MYETKLAIMAVVGSLTILIRFAANLVQTASRVPGIAAPTSGPPDHSTLDTTGIQSEARNFPG